MDAVELDRSEYIESRGGLRGQVGPAVGRVKYGEGDWFAVPLCDGGFAVGLVARANPNGVLLGYFFGPRRVDQPAIDQLADLKPGDAALVGKFGHLGLAGGTWPILGRFDGWDRAEWPMPVFLRHEELTGRSLRVFYDDADPNRFIREERIDASADVQGPKDGLMGAGSVEKRLTRLLR